MTADHLPPPFALSLVEPALQRAGALLLAMQGEVRPQEKAPGALVTAADLAAEALILDALRDAVPGAGWLSEERPPQGAPATPLCWVLDPLDGTANYAAGLRTWAISLALLQEGSPVAAWVFAPALDQRFVAHRGRGATLNGAPLAPLGAPPRLLAAETGLLSPTPGHPDRQALQALMQAWGELRMFGSQALELCWVAAGRLAAAVAPASRLWDEAAGALVLQEVGGLHTSWHGQPLFPLPPDDPRWRGQPYASLAGYPSVVAWIAQRRWADAGGPRP